MFTAGITFLPTADLDSTRIFYQDSLGLPLRLDQGTCLIFQITPESHIGFCSGLKPVDQPNEIIVTLVTDEVDSFHNHLSSKSVETDGPPRLNEKFQIHHFFTKDPNGYRVEVQKFLDPRW